MKQLLIEEMKRAVELLESKEVIRTRKWVGNYTELDRETSEIRQLLLMIRKHSVQLEKTFVHGI